MSDKPKLWNGPSPVGEGAARGNEISGAPYQTHIAPGVISRKMGVFSEVVKDEPPHGEEEELTVFVGGRINGESEVRFRGATDYSQVFKSTRVVALEPMGFNSALDGYIYTSPIKTGNSQYGGFEYFPEYDPRYPVSVLLEALTGNGSINLYFKKSFVGNLRVPIHTLMSPASLPTGGNANLIYHRMSVVPTGKLRADKHPRLLVVVPYESSVTDAYGLRTTGAAFCTVYMKGRSLPEATQLQALATPQEEASSFEPMHACVVNPKTYAVFIAEYPPARRGEVSDFSDVRYSQTWNVGGVPVYGVVSYEGMEPKLWMYKTEDSGSTWQKTRLTIFEQHVPVQQKAYGQVMSETQPLFGFPQYAIAVSEYTGFTPFLLSYPKMLGSSIECFQRINDVGGSLTMVVMSDTKWLLLSNILDGRDYGNGVVAARAFIMRTEDAGNTWVAVESPVSSLVSSPAPPESDYTFNGTTLRDGVVLIRCAKGRMGYDREIRFLRSADYGVSWEEFTPVGVPELRSDKIGYIKVVENFVENGVAKTKIALPAWDGAASEYRLYVSTDDGDTWSRGRKLATSSVLQRMDHDNIANPTTEQADNFGTLDIRGPERNPAPLDIALPWRFNEDFE